jgi:phosphoenolpyruvate carboxykinase (GTP)
MASETTAAQAGAVGKLRFDPMAMLPFGGYNMADYFQHWINVASEHPDRMPRIFVVNWFRKDERGKFVWPGYGENSRVLKWIVERLEGRAEAVDTPIGRLPAPGSLDISGLSLTPAQLDLLLGVDTETWRKEAALVPAFYERFGDQLPPALWAELEALVARLEAPARKPEMAAAS